MGKQFTKFILNIYVVYRAGKIQFVLEACRIGRLVRVAIPAPQILMECDQTPFCKVGFKAARWESFSCKGKLEGFASEI